MNILYRNTNFFLIVIILIGLISCHRDNEELDLIDTYIPSPKIVQEFSGNLQVFVADINGAAMPEVEVFVYNESLKSNDYGIVNFNNIALDQNGTYIYAIKDNYFFGSHRLFPSGTDNYATVYLLPIENMTTFENNTTVTLEINGGGRIEIKSNSLEDQNGQLYNGEVSAYIKRISTENQDVLNLMPGNLIGIDKKGNTQALGSFGMLALDFYGASGQQLFLNKNKPATVSFPIRDNLISEAPEEIALWKFDFGIGYWIEESIAFLEGEEYAAEISDFGFWNCAIPYDIIDFEGKIVDENGNPVSKANVLISSNPPVYIGTTDKQGDFAGKLPRDKELILEVFIKGCDEPIYQSSFGPFETDVELDEITLQNNSTEISGSITCLGLATSKGLVVVQSGNQFSSYKTDENGNFDILINETICKDEPEISLFGLDPETNISSPPVNIDFQSISSYAFEVCATCDYNLNIESEYQTPCNLSNVINVQVENGSGSYEYEWSSGEVTSEIVVSESGNYCVTVSDLIAKCDKVECIEIVINEEIIIEFDKVDIECNNTGFISVNATGGDGNYNFYWSGPGGFTADGELVDGINLAGTYVVNVEDSNGCIETLPIEIEKIDNFYDLTILSSESANVLCGSEPHYLEVLCPSCPFPMEDVSWTKPGGGNEIGAEIEALEGGLYNVYIDAGGCIGEGSFQMQQVIFDDPIIESDCEEEVYKLFITGFNANHTLQYDVPEREEVITNFQEHVNQEFFIQSEYASCNKFYSQQVPYTEGQVEYIKQVPTCDLCEDGNITVDLTGANFINCTYSFTSIYSENDLQTDLYEDNLQSLLVKGNYYVVLKSTDGCIINSELVEL